MRKFFYITAICTIAFAPGMVLVGCSGLSGIQEVPAAEVQHFVVQSEFTTSDGTLVQIGLINGDPNRLGQRQEKDGVETFLEKIDPWVAQGAGDLASKLGFGSLSGALTALLVLGGKSFADKKWKSA